MEHCQNFDLIRVIWFDSGRVFDKFCLWNSVFLEEKKYLFEFQTCLDVHGLKALEVSS